MRVLLLPFLIAFVYFFSVVLTMKRWTKLSFHILAVCMCVLREELSLNMHSSTQ